MHVEPQHRAHSFHPIALVGIVARAEIDRMNAVAVDRMGEQCMAKQGSGRVCPGILDVGELVDVGGTVLDGPWRFGIRENQRRCRPKILRLEACDSADHQNHPGLKRTAGHIGFLGHGDVIRFRNIRVRKL